MINTPSFGRTLGLISAVCLTAAFQGNAEEPLGSAQNQSQSILDQAKKQRAAATAARKNNVASRTQPTLLQCNDAFPTALLSKRGKDWRAVNSPELRDQDGNQVRTIVYAGKNEYGTNYQSFICLLNHWLSLGDSPVDPGATSFPQSVRLDDQRGYFLHSNKEYWGVRMSDVSKAKNGDNLSSLTWLRANPGFASMLVVDFPKGTDRNEPLVFDALEAMQKENLLGLTPYENQNMRRAVGKVVASKLRALPNDRDVHVKLFKSIASNSDDIGLIWDEIDGAVHVNINLTEVKTASQ